MEINKFLLQPNQKPLDNIDTSCGFAGIFKSIGVIGDSLSSGEFESRDENGTICYHDMYEYSWPAILQRITGTTYNNYSRGGMTTREYFTSWADSNNFWQRNQGYIIALGNNDTFVFGHPLGSVKDINVKQPQKNADTFFGNLGKIISKLKLMQADCRIFLVSPQLRGEECDTVIKQISQGLGEVCKLFSYTYLMDMSTYAPAYDHNMRQTFGLGFHPNPMGYHAYALMVGNYMDYIIKSNMADFAQLAFVGSNLKF